MTIMDTKQLHRKKIWGQQTCILLRKADNAYPFNPFAFQETICGNNDRHLGDLKEVIR